MSGKGFGVEAAPVYLSLPLLPALGAHCMAQPVVRGIRSAQYGILVNATLAMAKLIAGLVGNTYAPHYYHGSIYLPSSALLYLRR